VTIEEWGYVLAGASAAGYVAALVVLALRMVTSLRSWHRRYHQGSAWRFDCDHCRHERYEKEVSRG
jgi:hypothetical protein